MSIVTSNTLAIDTPDGRRISVLHFFPQQHEIGDLIMNYGFPGDIRNYDIATRLSKIGYSVYIPHPFGIEDSEGIFTFKDAGVAFETTLRKTLAQGNLLGIVSYCYSTLWVVKTLVKDRLEAKFMMLAPILDWQDARKRIENIVNGGFSAFIESCQHGPRQGFYGVRCNIDSLVGEHILLEKDMNLKTILDSQFKCSVTTVFGERDLFVDRNAIFEADNIFHKRGLKSKVKCLANTGHHFTLKRKQLTEEILSWLKE